MLNNFFMEGLGETLLYPRKRVSRTLKLDSRLRGNDKDVFRNRN